jgi:hypothetical protein
MEAREHADRLVKYFERRVHENEGGEVWQKGLNTAEEWLRLIDSENVSQSELSVFLGVVHANRYRTSGWNDLAAGAYHWVLSKGLPVPPPKEFFASDSLPNNSHLFKLSSLEHARALNKIFQQNNDEDPTNEGWVNGVQVTQEWERLIQKEQKDGTEISSLVKNASYNQRKYFANVWLHTVLTIGLWCKAIGYLHLVPDDFRDMVVKSETPRIK